MTGYILRRVLQLPPVLIGITILVFALLLVSGDPVELLSPPDATPEYKTELKTALGLDQPLYVQYGRFLSKAVRGDFGNSFFLGESATSAFMRRFPNTLKLAVAAVIFSTVIAIPFGIIASMNRGRLVDQAVMIFAVFGQSIATFWLALMLMLVFAVWLGWLPVAGNDTPRHFILPVVALGIHSLALKARLTRSGMLEVLRQDYIRTAQSKGLTNRLVLVRHALRNALIPLVTVIGLNFGFLLGGTVVIEVIFAWPGVGSLMINSIFLRDAPVVLAVVVYLAIVFVMINLAVDVLYAYIDPRIRYGKKG